MSQATLLVLGVLLVGVAVADYGLRVRQEHKYTVEGRSLTGLALKPQYAGVHYRGTLRVQVKADNLLYMKLQDMTYLKIHEEIPTGWWGKVDNSNNPFRDLPVTGSTIVVKLDRGQVRSVTMDKETEEWERNFINGLVSQLQMDMVGANMIHDTDKNIRHRLEKESSVYSVMEDSVLGNCEVIYEVSPYPKSMAIVNNDPLPRDDLCGNRNYLQVVKTRNFSNCEVNVEYHFGLPKFKRCRNGGNQCGDVWSRSSVTRVLGCGERKDFLVLNSVRSSRILTNLHFHNGSQASVNSYLNLTLESVKPTSRHFNPPTDLFTIKSLLFKHTGSTNAAKRKEGKWVSGASAHTKKTKYYEKSLSVESEEQNVTSSQRYKLSNKNKNSSEMYSDQPSPKLKSNRQHLVRKQKQNTTPTPAASESSEESSEEIKTQVWSVPKSDANHAPQLPFSPYSLAYRQENEGSCLVQQFKDIVNDIVNDFEAPTIGFEDRPMEKIYIAVQMCQTMSIYDLKKLVTGVVDSRSRQNQRHLTERKIYRDILTVCGTNPAFQIIKSWIEDKVVKGEEAAEIMTVLPSHLLTPDSEVVQKFYDLIRSSAVNDDAQLKVSAILAFSNLLRVACINKEEMQSRYSSNIMRPMCTHRHASRYISWFINQLRAEPEQKLVYIKALGNTGSNLALNQLQNIAESNNYSTMQRSFAVFAMKFQVFSNKTTIPKLLSIFHNVDNPSSVRIAAVSMLFYAKLSLTIWQRIAISTWFEPNPVLAAFIRSSLSTFAVVQDSVYKEVAQSASSVYSLSKPISLSPQHAYNLVRSNIVDNLQETILEQFSWVPGPDASNMYYRHTQRVGDMSRIGFDGAVWLTNPDAFLTVLQELVYPSDDVTRARPMIKNLPRSTKWIRDTLKIEPRVLPRLEGAVRLSFNHLTERLFAFDKKISVYLAKSARELVEEMKEGKQFHYQKFDQSSMVIATATEMGFLVNMHVEVPWAIRAVGNASVNNSSKEFNMKASVSYISKLIADVSVFTEWDQSIHVAASYGLSLVNLPPISYYAKLNKSLSMVELGVSLNEPKENNVVLHHSSKSFTVQEDAFSLDPWGNAKSTRVLHMKEPTQLEFLLAPHVKLIVSTEAVKRSPYTYEEDAISVQGFPMMWSSMENNWFEVHVKNISDITLDIGLGEATLENGQVNITRNAGEFSGKPRPDMTTTTEEPETTSVTSSTTDHTETTETTTESTTESETTSTTIQTTTTTAEERTMVFENAEEDVLTYSIDFVEDPANFNASQIEPFIHQGYGSGYNYLLNNILKGINQGRAFVVGMNVTVNSEEPMEYTMFASYAGGMAGRLQRVGLFFKDNNTNDQASWTASMFTPPTPILNFTEIVRSNMISRFYSDYDYKESDDHYQVFIEGTIGRTERKRTAMNNWMRHNSTIYQQCVHEGALLSPECYNNMQDAALMSQYNLTINYNDKVRKSSADVASFYLKLAKYNLLPYVSEVYTDNSEEAEVANNVQVHVDVDGDGNTVDVLVLSPTSETQFSGVPLNSLVTAALHKSSEYSMAQRLTTTGYCGISNNSVVTYDGVHFKYNLGNCWHLMTKDCSGKSRIAVLVRRIGLKTNLTELEVNLDNYKVVSLMPGPELRVNQRMLHLQQDQVAELRDQEGTLLIQMAVTPDSAIKMTLPSHGFLVLYSNNTVIVQADKGTQGRLCGICGDNDNNRIREFKSPHGKVELFPFEFASSYVLKDSDCKEYPKETKKSK